MRDAPRVASTDEEEEEDDDDDERHAELHILAFRLLMHSRARELRTFGGRQLSSIDEKDVFVRI